MIMQVTEQQLRAIVRQAVRDELANLSHPVPKLAYSIPEAAAATGRTEHEIRHAISRAELKTSRRGKRIMIPSASLERWANG